MNKNIGIGVVALMVVLALAYALAGNKSVKDVYIAEDAINTENIENTENIDQAGTDESGMDQSGEDTTDATADVTIAGDVQTTRAGTYESYSANKISMAQTGDVVIFFHASWCPSCRALNSDIEKNVSSLPQGLVVLKADYDKETELKKKYGVTSQHTLVQVDKDGNLIKKWTGGSKVADLVAQVI
jgi:thioredoxin 1